MSTAVRRSTSPPPWLRSEAVPGNIEETARRLDVDRRTVKARLAAQS